MRIARGMGSRAAQSRSLHDDLVSTMGEVIEGDFGEEGILEQRHPFIDRAIARDDRGRATVPLDELATAATAMPIAANRKQTIRIRIVAYLYAPFCAQVCNRDRGPIDSQYSPLPADRHVRPTGLWFRSPPTVKSYARGRTCASLPPPAYQPLQVDFASRHSLDARTHHARLALPWNTLLAGLVWIIQIVSPWGGST